MVKLFPGLLILLLGALISFVISNLTSFNGLIISIALGFIFANTVGVPEWSKKGIATHKLWLETGISVMGARVAVGQFLGVGSKVLLVVFGVFLFTIFYIEFLSRKIYGITDQLGSLLAAGSSVCGVSAIVAVAGAIRARSEQIAYAVGTILLFDALTLTIYPVVGRLLNLSDIVFGTWAGVSMFSTGPVVAVGFTYSEDAGQWATIAKLARNALIGIVAISYAIYYTRMSTTSGTNRVYYIWSKFPKFIFGFTFMVILSSVGFISENEFEILKILYRFLFLIAFFGLGSNIVVSDMTKSGFKPIITLTTSFITISLSSLIIINLLLG